MRFSSSILPPWARKTPKVGEALPLLYLHGLSSGDFAPALGEFFGGTPGCRHQRSQADQTGQPSRGVPHRTFRRGLRVPVRRGIHFNVRLEEARLCALVIVGVRNDGTKELVSITDGHRESTESWADVLRSLKRRGMTAPVLAVGDGALGFWGALGEVFPTPPTRNAGSTRWPTS